MFKPNQCAPPYFINLIKQRGYAKYFADLITYFDLFIKGKNK